MVTRFGLQKEKTMRGRKFYKGGHKLYKGVSAPKAPAYVSAGWRIQESPRFGGVFGKKGNRVEFIPYSRLLKKRR